MATKITARQSLKKYQKGTALTEAVLVLNVFLIILGILIDTYYIVHAYEALNRATREALIIGSVLQKLQGEQKNIDLNESDYETCIKNDLDSYCHHMLIHWRVHKILESQHSGIKDDSLNITTTVKVDSPFKRVTLNVSGRVNGVTPLSYLLTLRVQESIAILGE